MMKMNRMKKKTRSKLEEIVPPLDMCMQIPEGAFKDSVLVLIYWWKSPNTPTEIRFRFEVETDPEFADLVEDQRIIIFPAPTLAEIMESDNHIHCAISELCPDSAPWIAVCWVNGEWVARNAINPTTAAMKLWLGVNGCGGADDRD